jgi:hypothetical protein
MATMVVHGWMKQPCQSQKASAACGVSQRKMHGRQQGRRQLCRLPSCASRIHVADIAQAIGAAFACSFSGIVNVTDDEPAPPQDVVAYAAGLLEVPVPPDIAFETAELSPMARSFYGENKRVKNMKLRQQLNVNLLYPHYRSALTALKAEGEGQDKQ